MSGRGQHDDDELMIPADEDSGDDADEVNIPSFVKVRIVGFAHLTLLCHIDTHSTDG
jgi:hypothetical protein